MTMNLRKPQPYEVLKAALDEARADFLEKLHNIMRNVNHQDGPLLLLMDIETLFASYAVLESPTEAFTREYAHMAEINDQITAQRDEINRKFESFKRTLNQLNLDDDLTSAPSATPKSTPRKRRK